MTPARTLVLMLALTLAWMAFAPKVLAAEPDPVVIAGGGPLDPVPTPAPAPAEMDLTAPSGLTAEDLRLRYNLRGLEAAFVAAVAAHGVRADFLAAVAALESGWGRYQFRPNNIMGFGQLAFASPEECIDHVAAYLAANYLDPDGIYYNGPTVAGVCVRYNGRAAWAAAVAALMEEIRP